jgi:hypothetical protein
MKLLGYLFTEARKAVVAGVGAAIGVAIAGVQQDYAAHGTITQADAEQIIGAAVVLGFLAGLATWRTANKPST